MLGLLRASRGGGSDSADLPFAQTGHLILHLRVLDLELALPAPDGSQVAALSPLGTRFGAIGCRHHSEETLESSAPR
jgi:hypothetical protein